MTSKYFFKDISVSNICTNNGINVAVSGYNGMPNPNATSYSGLRPLTFGYTSGTPSVDICNQYKAPITDIITTSQIINIRSGSKACRVISVGGAGGGGGHGGKASSYSYDGDDANYYGGDGGRGGYGSYTYNNYISLAGHNTISVTIGGGGGGSNVGGNDKVTSNYIEWSTPVAYNNNKANAGKGGDGGAGGATYIVLNGTTAWLSAADGGNGGIGGKGAEANASGKSATGVKGAGGEAGNSTVVTSNNANFPVLSNYGIPSTKISVDGSETGGGAPGEPGALQIIWLYD
jgi:hypothetical protein